MRVAGLSCTREIRTMFSLFARKIVADGGPPQDGAFYEVAGAGIVPLRECFSEHVLIYMYIHKHHARIMNTEGGDVFA